MGEFLREHTAGSVIKSSFRIYFGNLPVLFGIYLLPVLPGAIYGAFAPSVGRGDPAHAVMAGLLQLIGGIVALAPMTVALSDICLGNRPHLGRSYARLKAVIWRLLGTWVVVSVLLLVGMLLLIIPFFVVVVLTMFALTVVVLESRSPMESIRRSIQLGRGYYWRNFGVLLLLGLVVGVLWLVIGVVVGLISVGVGADMQESFGFQLIVHFFVLLIAPLQLIPVVLLYYDMRVRKENYDAAALATDILG